MYVLLRRRREALLRTAGAVLLSGFLGACHDAPNDPLALVLASETQAALAIGTELPALPALAARAGVTPKMREVLDLWEASWEAEPEVGQEAREGVYDLAAPELIGVLGRQEADRAAAAVGSALEAVTALDPTSLEPTIAAAVTRASALHAQGRAALDDGRSTEALALEMEASDALRTIAPPGVARSLLARAEAALATRGDSLADADLERAERLLDGARKAVAREDWSKAIQRSFYAYQLLGR